MFIYCCWALVSHAIHCDSSSSYRFRHASMHVIKYVYRSIYAFTSYFEFILVFVRLDIIKKSRRTNVAGTRKGKRSKNESELDVSWCKEIHALVSPEGQPKSSTDVVPFRSTPTTVIPSGDGTRDQLPFGISNETIEIGFFPCKPRMCAFSPSVETSRSQSCFVMMS